MKRIATLTLFISCFLTTTSTLAMKKTINDLDRKDLQEYFFGKNGNKKLKSFINDPNCDWRSKLYQKFSNTVQYGIFVEKKEHNEGWKTDQFPEIISNGYLDEKKTKKKGETVKFILNDTKTYYLFARYGKLRNKRGNDYVAAEMEWSFEPDLSFEVASLCFALNEKFFTEKKRIMIEKDQRAFPLIPQLPDKIVEKFIQLQKQKK